MRTAGQRDARDKVAELVDRRRRRGRPVATGGAAPDGAGFYYPPTVLTDVPPTQRSCRPRSSDRSHRSSTFSTEDEAIALANNTEYGLVVLHLHRRPRPGLRVSERIEAGMVGLNRGLVSDPAAPFGGVKESGLGREGGVEGLLAFTESKYVAVNW